MKRLMMGLAVLGVVSLSACGGNPCAQVKAANDRVAGGKSTCSGSGASVEFKDTSMACNTNISKCSAAELTAVDDYVKCMSAVPVCTAGNESATASGTFGCALALATKLSGDCANGFK